jgi:superfamily I DNA and/or RNA helicase
MAVDGLTLRLHAADPSMRLVRVGDPERIDAAALNLTADAAAGRRAPLVEAEAQLELRRRLDELRADQRMGPERKAQMRDYVRRNTRRLVQKRLARGSEEAMSDAQVLLCTTTAAADKCVLRVPTLDMVVLDEAAQATAPNAWVALLRGRRAVLLGDPQQLPPTLLSRDAAAAGLGTSLMEWAQQEQPGSATLLDTQWRMHAAIAAWSSAQFYGGRLRSHPSVATRVLADLPGISRNSLTASPLLGVSVGGGNSERRGANGEISNELEARAVVSHVASLLRAGVPASDVLVISPYGAQVALLRRLLLDAAATAQRPDQPTHALSAVEVATVDASQGREAEAVIVSLVRSNRRRAVGFLADARRLNVAVTRASRHLALVCDPSTVGSDPLLATLLDHVAALGEWRAPDVGLVDIGS